MSAQLQARIIPVVYELLISAFVSFRVLVKTFNNMTTAARPTWAPAKGGDEQGGSRMFGPSQKFSSRDLASHNKMKLRQGGQNAEEDLRSRDLREELEDKERRHFSSRGGGGGEGRRRGTQLLEHRRDAEERVAAATAAAAKSLDADDSDGDARAAGGAGGGSDDDDDDDDDDEDDTAELLAELERIKRERAEEKARREREAAAEAARAKEAELRTGNPLMDASVTGGPAAFSVKRRWDDDVVFRNQSRGEAKPVKRFINDTIRSDFHRKFLSKYIK